MEATARPRRMRGRSKTCPSSASHSLGTCPYPFCRCATSPLVKGRWPKARGDREGEYERGALILSRPPAILWFLSHRWERNSPPAGGEISPPKQQISAGAAKSPARTSRSGASGRPRPTEEAKISGGGGGKPPPYSILLTMPAPQTVPSSAPFRGTWPYPLYLPLDKGSRPSRGRL